MKVFREIRVQHILNDLVSIKTVEADKIVPGSKYMCFNGTIKCLLSCVGWLLKLYRTQWLKMLAVDQRLDPGLETVVPSPHNSIITLLIIDLEV